MANRLSIGMVWEDAARFCRAEAALLLPVAAVGFGLPLVMMLLAVPAEQAASGKLQPGAWMAWFLPCGLFSMMGTIAISAMALRPGATVRECLAIGVARLPTGIGLVALHLGFQVALALPAALLARLDIAMRGAPGILALTGNVFALAVTIWLFARVMPIWALLSERPIGPWAAVRAVFAATQGRYRTLLLVRVVGGFAGVIALTVTLVPIGAVCALLGMAAGAPAMGATISFVVSGLVFGTLVTLWTVYVARLYRALGSNSGI